MGYLGLFRKFFREAMGYVTPDADAVDQLGESAPRHSTYHKRIVGVCIVFGVLGVIVGLGFSITEFLGPHPSHENFKLLLTPFMAAAAGILFGAAMACLFAPHEFLTGPIGKKWMTLIGTKNVLGARIVCFMVAMIPVAFAIVVMWSEARKRH